MTSLNFPPTLIIGNLESVTMSRFTLTIVLGVGIVFAGAAPAFAQTTNVARPGAVSTKAVQLSKISSHIDKLRNELKITPAQQPQWHALAGVMRQNASQMNTLYQQRTRNADKMNAVQILKSYRDFTSIHLKALNQLIPVFTKFYAVLSPAQKKTADEMFENRVAALSGAKKAQ